MSQLPDLLSKSAVPFAVHTHSIGDFLKAAGAVGVVIAVIVVVFWMWLNSRRTWFGGWRNRGPMTARSRIRAQTCAGR
jgi:hypothetical protein